MPPRLHSQDGRNIVIRPLAFCTEADLAEYATEMSFPIIPCDLCGSQENLQRKKIKRLIAQLASENDKIRAIYSRRLGKSFQVTCWTWN